MRAPAFLLAPVLAGLLVAMCTEVLAEAAIKAQEGNVQNWIEFYERERAVRTPRSVPPREADESAAPSVAPAPGEEPPQPARDR
jgi:hypothetical protein